MEKINTAKTQEKKKKRNRKRNKVLNVENTTKAIGTISHAGPKQRGMRVKLQQTLSHTLGLRERQFVKRFLDPNGEEEILTDNCKIPDGALTNSFLVGLREAFVIVCPFLPNDGSLLTSNMWTLIAIKTPFLKTNLILVALDQQGDISSVQMSILQDTLNTLLVPVNYPDWVTTQDPKMKISFKQWTTLEGIPNDDPDTDDKLMSQFRLCNWAITCWDNTPDLVNQGMVMMGQWNLDIHPVSAEGVAGSDALEEIGVPYQFFFNVPASGNAGSDSLSGVAQTPNLQTRIIKYYNANNWRTDSFEFVSAQDGYVVEQGGGRVTIPAGSNLFYEFRYNPENNIISCFLAGLSSPSEIRLAQHSLAPGITVNIANSVVWYLSSLSDQIVPKYIVNLPPLTTSEIIQSTPKAVYLSMKQDNGYYMVGRVFQPVFNVQESSGRRRFAFTAQNGNRSSALRSMGGIVDIHDLNFGIGVAVMAGIPYACAPSFKTISDVEGVADEGPWQVFMHSNEEKSENAIDIARTIMDAQPFGYPESYNSMSFLADLVGDLVEKIPIIGTVVPAVRTLVKTFNNAKSSGQVSNRLSNLPREIAQSALESLLQSLNL